jgi:hypothetical protein
MNYQHHSFDIVQDIVVPKAQDTIAARFHEFRARCIRYHPIVLRMTAAIDFDNHSTLVACKIRKVRPDRCLPAKMRVANMQSPEMPPKFTLRVSHCAP